MNFQFMVAKSAESGFSLFFVAVIFYFYQFFRCKMHENSVFSAFWSMNPKFMVNDFGVCYNINKEAN